MRFWLRRYLCAEVAALVSALLGVTLAGSLTTDTFILVAVTVYSSSAGYYGVIFVHRLIVDRRTQQSLDGHATRRAAISTVRALLLEFGSAELLDSLLFSPLLLYLCLRILPNPQLAVALSELASTLAFYATVIVAQGARRVLDGES
jgi:hypothetical protein